MVDKLVHQPGPDHPVTILANPNRVIVSVGGSVVANSAKALTLREADYPPAHYIPMANVDTAQLQKSDSESYCY